MNQTCFEAAKAHPHKATESSRRHARVFFLVLPMLLLAFTPQLAAKKKADVVYDKTVDFSRYKTYAWVQGFPMIDPRMDQYIIHSVDDMLRSIGLKQTKVSAADLVVTYNAARDSDLSVGTALDPTFAATGGLPLSGHSIWATSSTGGVSTHVRKGSLNFEILDRKANKTIWSGTAKGTISEKPGDHWSQVQKALDNLFHDYPPTQTKGKQSDLTFCQIDGGIQTTGCKPEEDDEISSVDRITSQFWIDRGNAHLAFIGQRDLMPDPLFYCFCDFR